MALGFLRELVENIRYVRVANGELDVVGVKRQGWDRILVR